ncbi:POLA2, partial [Symbiodinium sp. CCMP2456]
HSWRSSCRRLAWDGSLRRARPRITGPSPRRPARGGRHEDFAPATFGRLFRGPVLRHLPGRGEWRPQASSGRGLAPVGPQLDHGGRRRSHAPLPWRHRRLHPRGLVRGLGPGRLRSRPAERLPPMG